MDTLASRSLDLRDFVWIKDHVAYIIMAITKFKNEDVVVYREAKDRGVIEVETVDVFCRDYQASYQLI